MIRSLKICQHSFSAWMMVRTVSASAPACISIRSSPLSILAAVPLPAGLAEISVKHTSSAGYYLRVHGTTPDSIVFSHFL